MAWKDVSNFAESKVMGRERRKGREKEGTKDGRAGVRGKRKGCRGIGLWHGQGCNRFCLESCVPVILSLRGFSIASLLRWKEREREIRAKTSLVAYERERERESGGKEYPPTV